MHFDSFAAALAMDGHGPYVWFVYAVALLVVSWMLLAPVLRSRRIMVRTRTRLRREERAQNSAATEVENAPGS